MSLRLYLKSLPTHYITDALVTCLVVIVVNIGGFFSVQVKISCFHSEISAFRSYHFVKVM